MSDQYFTIDQLVGRLKIGPESFRALLSEIAEQLTREYLTIERDYQTLRRQKGAMALSSTPRG